MRGFPVTRVLLLGWLVLAVTEAGAQVLVRPTAAPRTARPVSGPQPGLTAATAAAAAAAVRVSTLLVLTQGSPGGELERWGESLAISKLQQVTLRLRGTVAGAATARWELADRPFEEARVNVLKDGTLAQAPQPAKIAVFNIELSGVLPTSPPSPPRHYFLRVTTLDAAQRTVGPPSNPVRITYALPQVLVLPAVEVKSPGSAVRISQTCGADILRLTLCVADARQGWQAPVCSETSFPCSPYACHKGGTTCNTACLTNGDCKRGARCVISSGLAVVGTCVMQYSLCSLDGDSVITPSGSLGCGLYRCTDWAGPARCLESCMSTADCVRGFACDADMHCVRWD
ncbi:MAG: hypothetical protein V1750_04090 [Acidobacteriota bacterium]